MRNAFLSSMSLMMIAAALTVAGCSSEPTAKDTTYVKPKGPEVVYVKPGDRMPAQANQQVVTNWVAAPINLSIQRNNLNTSTVVNVVENATITQQVWDATRTKQELRDVPYTTTCQDWVCDGGNGSSPLWDAFYSAPKARKAEALANAVKGVGQKSAQALVDRGYFHSKPRSWQAFAAEINRAADNGVIQKSAASAVLQQYSSENAESLGYSENTCHYGQAYSCTKYSPQYVTVSDPGYVTKTFTQQVDQRVYNVDVHVNNARLLTGETDRVTFYVDQNGNISTNSLTGNYNHYAASSAIEGNHVNVTLQDDQRFMTNLSTNVVQRDTLMMVGSTPTFVLDIDPGFLPNSEDPTSQLVLNYTIWTCDVSGLTHNCKLFNPKERALKSANQVLTTARTQVGLDPNGLNGSTRIWIAYNISRQGSQYYSSTPIPDRGTEKINIR